MDDSPELSRFSPSDSCSQHVDTSSVLPPFLAELNGQRGVYRPVWFMRQAGRSLPEYRTLRAEKNLPMLEACLDVETVVEATLQPVRRHGVDAAIFFSDIMVPLRLAGVEVEIASGIGPVVERPVRDRTRVSEVTQHEFGAGSWRDHSGLLRSCESGVAAIESAVGKLIRALGREGNASTVSVPEHHYTHSKFFHHTSPHASVAQWIPLIAFGGAPFTLAAYLVEGKPSRDHLAARALMLSDPQAWDALMQWCARVTGEFIGLQLSAGARAAQLFDSWAGSLKPSIYRKYVAPYSALALEHARAAALPRLGPDLLARIPFIHFGTGTAHILSDMLHAGANAVGVDDKTDLAWAIQQLEGSCPVQGNINPAILSANWESIREEIDECVRAGKKAQGHVLNLGHGVPQHTDPQVLSRIVEYIHTSTRGAGSDCGA